MCPCCLSEPNNTFGGSVTMNVERSPAPFIWPSSREASMRQMFSFCRLNGGLPLDRLARASILLFFFFRVGRLSSFDLLSPFISAGLLLRVEWTTNDGHRGVISNTCQQVRPFWRFLNAFVSFCSPPNWNRVFSSAFSVSFAQQTVFIVCRWSNTNGFFLNLCLFTLLFCPYHPAINS